VQRAIIKHGGSLVRLVMALIDRPFRPAGRSAATSRPPNPRFETPGGTGPP
jgi:hypothetical protein